MNVKQCHRSDRLTREVASTFPRRVIYAPLGSLNSSYHRLDAGSFLLFASFVSVLFHELVGGFKGFSFSGPSIV